MMRGGRGIRGIEFLAVVFAPLTRPLPSRGEGEGKVTPHPASPLKGRGVKRRFFNPPHPDPLPEGEGEMVIHIQTMRKSLD